MSTIRLHRTTTSTPEQYVAGLTDFEPGRSSFSATARTRTSRCITRAPRKPRSRKARPASGNACNTTGPIPVALCSRRPIPMCGVAHQATPIPSHAGRTALPTLTSWWCATARMPGDGCSALCSGPSASGFWKGRSKTPSRPSNFGIVLPRSYRSRGRRHARRHRDHVQREHRDQRDQEQPCQDGNII